MSAQIVVHELYLFVYETSQRASDDAKMMKVLEFINNNVKTINNMGIKIDIKKYTSKELTGKHQLLEKFRIEGITFPCLKTPNKIYHGFEEIKKVYLENISNWESFEAKKERIAGGVSDSNGDELEDYMKAEIGVKTKDEIDEEEDGLNSQGNNLSQLHAQAMQLRDSKKPQKPIRGIDMSMESNVKTPSENPKDTISRLAGQQGNQGPTRISVNSGTPDLDDDGGDSRDDALAAVYAARNEDSMPVNSD